MGEGEKGLLALDVDVAAWLHEIADKYYEGDVQKSLNEALRALMTAETPPVDLWATPMALASSRSGGKRVAQKSNQRSGKP